MKTKKIAAIAALLLAGQAVHAGQVGSLTSFTAHTPAKADEVNGNFNAVKSAVNDNDTRLVNVEAAVAGAGVKGALFTLFGGSQTFGNSASDTIGYSGYYPLAPVAATPTSNLPTSSYTLPQGVTSAKAHVQTTCSFNGKLAGQLLQTQAVIRSPANPGSANDGTIINIVKGPINEAPLFIMPSGTPGPNIMVQITSFDYFDLTAGNSYDFGVWFSSRAPGGTEGGGGGAGGGAGERRGEQ